MAQTLRNLNKVDAAGRHVLGTPWRGILGANIPTASIFYNDLSLPADAGKEYSGRILTWPSSGVYYLREDGTGVFTPANDGTFTTTCELVENGVDIGVETTTFLSGGGTIITAPFSAVASGTAATIVTTTNTTISTTPGNAVASGSKATIVTTAPGATTVSTVPGNAVAAGATATVVSSILVSADLQVTYTLTGSATQAINPSRTVVFGGGKRTVRFLS